MALRQLLKLSTADKGQLRSIVDFVCCAKGHSTVIQSPCEAAYAKLSSTSLKRLTEEVVGDLVRMTIGKLHSGFLKRW